MKSEDREYIEFRLQQARLTLEDAETPFRSGSLASVVNRLYYACFYAVSALLFMEGLSSTRHKGVLSAFDRHWISTGRLPKRMGRLLHALFDARLQGDYGYPASLEREDVERSLEETRSFISDISHVVTRQLSDE